MQPLFTEALLNLLATSELGEVSQPLKYNYVKLVLFASLYYLLVSVKNFADFCTMTAP